jgi:predicted DNA-binding transcriptional regulator YafY
MPENSRGISHEKLYTVNELAAEWGLSPDTIRRRFANERGVIVISNSKPGKRPYRTLRIPPSVADRVRNA